MNEGLNYTFYTSKCKLLSMKSTVKYLYLEVGGTSEKLQDIRVFEISKIVVSPISMGTCICTYQCTIFAC
jgi:hypothetical protein